MRIRTGLLALALVFGVGLTASAATVTFNFDTANSGNWTNALVYTDAGTGLSLTVTGKTTDGGKAKVATWRGFGLGVCNRNEAPGCHPNNHQVDSRGLDDVVTFAFGKAVKLVNIMFNFVDKTDTFDLYTGSILPVLTGEKVLPSWDAEQNLLAASYGVGAGTTFIPCIKRMSGMACHQTRVDSEFKIRSITVETATVPVPAAGFLLVGGLGALGALRRRKAA